MSERYANMTAYIVLLIVAVLYLNTAYGFDSTTSNTIGPGYFPKLLGFGLAIFCIIGLINSFRQKASDNNITIENMKMVLIAIVTTVLFLVAWYYIGNFYIITFVFLAVLTAIFRKESGFSKRNLLIIIGSSLFMVGTIYLLFDVFMKLSM